MMGGECGWGGGLVREFCIVAECCFCLVGPTVMGLTLVQAIIVRFVA